MHLNGIGSIIFQLIDSKNDDSIPVSVFFLLFLLNLPFPPALFFIPMLIETKFESKQHQKCKIGSFPIKQLNRKKLQSFNNNDKTSVEKRGQEIENLKKTAAEFFKIDKGGK